MKEFTIKIPVTGYVELTVDAEDENSAIDKAFDMATLSNLEEWNLHHKIVEDDKCHALLNEVKVCVE